MAERDEKSRQEEKSRNLAVTIAAIVLLLSVAIQFGNQILAQYVIFVFEIKDKSIRDPLVSQIEDRACSLFFEPLFIVSTNPKHSTLAEEILDSSSLSLGPLQLKTLKGFLRSKNVQVKDLAIYLYYSYTIRQENSDFTLELLEDPDEKIREISLMPFQNTKYPGSLEPIISHMKFDSSPQVRVYACCICEASGDERAVDPLIDALSDTEPCVRSAAAESLWIVCAGKPCAEGRRIIFPSLFSVQIQRKPVDKLLKLIEDPDKDVRRSAVKALGSIGDNRAVEPLINLTDDPDDPIRKMSIWSLGTIGDRRALKPLIKNLKMGNDRDTLEETIHAIRDIDDASAVPALLPYLNDKDPDVRKMAIYVIGCIGNARAIPELEKIQKNLKEDEFIREKASESIECIKFRCKNNAKTRK